MAVYHQLKFPSTFIEYRSVREWKGVVVISNFDSFKSTALGSCLVCLGLNSPLFTYDLKTLNFCLRFRMKSNFLSGIVNVSRLGKYVNLYGGQSSFRSPWSLSWSRNSPPFIEPCLSLLYSRQTPY